VVSPRMRKFKLVNDMTKNRDGDSATPWMSMALQSSLSVDHAMKRKKMLVTNPIFRDLLAQTEALVGSLNARDLANLCRILNIFKIDDEALIQKIYAAVSSSLPGFNAFDLVMTLHSLTLLAGPNLPVPLLRQLVSQEDLVSQFSPQDLPLFVWCLTKHPLQQHAIDVGPLLSRVDSRALELVNTIRAQEFALLLYSLAHLGYTSPALFQGFEKWWSAPMLCEFTPQSLSNVCWAFGKLEVKPTSFFQGLLLEIKRRRREFDHQHISNIVWAHGRLQMQPDPRLLGVLTDEVARRAPYFTPQGLSNVAWGLARLDKLTQSLGEGISKAALREIGSFKPQELSNLAWAFGKARLPQEALLPQVSEEARKKAGDFTPQNISNLLWAFATLGVLRADHVQVFAPQILGGLVGFSEVDLLNLNWAHHKLPAPRQDLSDAISGRMMQLSVQKAGEKARAAGQ